MHSLTRNTYAMVPSGSAGRRKNASSATLLALVFAVICGTAATAASVTASSYGVTKRGQKVTAYTLTNDRGASAVILDYGATIAAVNVPDRNGKIGNAVMSFADVAGWEALGHGNAIIGRVANRITDGFTLDGVRYPLVPTTGNLTMHSGPTSYATRIWSVAPVRKQDGAALTLKLDSPDGDQGFPGHVQVTATYRFDNRNALHLDMTATTDKATPINLTNHIYFNLNGNSTTSADQQVLQIMTDQIAVLEPGRPPTGEIVSVVGTPFDFTKPTVIKERLGLSLGAAYDTAASAPPLPAGMTRSFNAPYFLRDRDRRIDRVAARLHDPISGRIAEVRTTEVSVHFYTPARMPEGHLSDAGKPFTRVPGIALELQHLPDSPNRPEFPSVILRPGQTFRSAAIYAFSTDGR